MSVFNEYSKYYDLLYSDKDYEKESNYIFDLIKKSNPNAKTILELGCGTGKHAKLLSEKGLKIHGIDVSQTMLDQALELQNDKISFTFGDVRNYRISKKFDAVISLFHVASYQNSNEDLHNFFETAALHLESGGVFIFDVWYGPTVLNQKPEARVKKLQNQFLEIERKANPVMHFNENIVDVNYEILITNKTDGAKTKLNETHKMRYLFKPELEFFLENSGFRMIDSQEWLSGKEISENTWGACFVAIKK